MNKWWLYFISWSGPKPLESHAYGCQLLALNRWYYLYLPVDLRLFGLHIIFLYAWLIYHLQKCFFNDWLISWELKLMIPTGSSKKKRSTHSTQCMWILPQQQWVILTYYRSVHCRTRRRGMPRSLRSRNPLIVQFSGNLRAWKEHLYLLLLLLELRQSPSKLCQL